MDELRLSLLTLGESAFVVDDSVGHCAHGKRLVAGRLRVGCGTFEITSPAPMMGQLNARRIFLRTSFQLERNRFMERAYSFCQKLPVQYLLRQRVAKNHLAGSTRTIVEQLQPTSTLERREHVVSFPRCRATRRSIEKRSPRTAASDKILRCSSGSRAAAPKLHRG